MHRPQQQQQQQHQHRHQYLSNGEKRVKRLDGKFTEE